MPHYSTRSLSRLDTCHRDLIALFIEVIKTWDCTILCGARSREEQDAAVASRASKARWPRSNHNVDGVKRTTSWAVDVAPYPIDWKDRQRFAEFAAFVQETADRLYDEGKMTHRIRWGGDWDMDGDWTDERFSDMPHYELVDVEHGS